VERANASARQKSQSDLALQGARELLTKCLSLRTGDVLALFWDGSTRETTKFLLRAADELQLNVRQRFVPVHEQVALGGQLTSEDYAALADARGILTCLSNNPNATAYRRELLDKGPSYDNFFGHMPGATPAVLTHAANVDFEAAERRCDDLALAYTLSRSAVLRTYDFDRCGERVREHELHLEFVGFGRSPISSTGIIPKGTWGNIPGGEVFIAPLEARARGVFSLNGAFKKHVLPKGSSIHLEFDAGHLAGVGGGSSRKAFEALLVNARRRGGPNYSALAELGVGVNSGVTELTGSALFDEKCAGTAHIAIGDNERYGGLNPAQTHEDLITWRPSLEFDGIPILSLGQDALDPRRFRESISDPPAGDFHIEPDDWFDVNGEVTTERTADGGLRVRRFVAAGRICQYTVGEAATSRVLFSIRQLIPAKASEIVGRAERELGLARDRVVRAMEILLRHHIIYRPPEE
jgi:hypothetical protein